MTQQSLEEIWQPYADTTSGHQGDGSQKAEPRRRDRLAEAHRFVLAQGPRGATWREYAAHYALHHGVASGALSNLHRSGSIARLRQKRGGCGIYVALSYVQDRPTVPHRSNKKNKKQVLLDRIGELSDWTAEGMREQVIQIIEEEL